MPVLGVINGVFRGLVLMHFMSEFRAKQLSSVLLVILLFVYTHLIYDRLNLRTTKDALFTGLLWMVLTVAFEFVLGYVLLNQPLDVMLQEYNVLDGKFWALVIILIFFLPLIQFKWKSNRATKMSNS